MPKIFIIGNGLDRAHGYNTSYHDNIDEDEMCSIR